MKPATTAASPGPAAGAAAAPKSSSDLLTSYETSLRALLHPAKPVINALTIIAGENLGVAEKIVDVIVRRVDSEHADRRLSPLYLMDSILKNVGGIYVTLFGKHIARLFASTYSRGNADTRKTLTKLLALWDNSNLFSAETRAAMHEKAKAAEAPVQMVQRIAITPAGGVAAAAGAAAGGGDPRKRKREEDGAGDPAKRARDAKWPGGAGAGRGGSGSSSSSGGGRPRYETAGDRIRIVVAPPAAAAAAAPIVHHLRESESQAASWSQSPPRTPSRPHRTPTPRFSPTSAEREAALAAAAAPPRSDSRSSSAGPISDSPPALAHPLALRDVHAAGPAPAPAPAAAADDRVPCLVYLPRSALTVAAAAPASVSSARAAAEHAVVPVAVAVPAAGAGTGALPVVVVDAQLESLLHQLELSLSGRPDLRAQFEDIRAQARAGYNVQAAIVQLNAQLQTPPPGSAAAAPVFVVHAAPHAHAPVAMDTSAGGLALPAGIDTNELLSALASTFGPLPGMSAVGSATSGGPGAGRGGDDSSGKARGDDDGIPDASEINSLGKGPLERAGPVALTQEYLRTRDREAVWSLYEGMGALSLSRGSGPMLQCKTCGLRLPTEEAQGKHLDWHFKLRKRDSRRAAQTLSQGWFLSASEWTDHDPSGFKEPVVPSGPPGAGADAGAGSGPGGDALGGAMPRHSERIDEAQKDCPICMEAFEKFWSDDEESWMYRDVVRLPSLSASAAAAQAKLHLETKGAPAAASPSASVEAFVSRALSDHPELGAFRGQLMHQECLLLCLQDQPVVEAAIAAAAERSGAAGIELAGDGDGEGGDGGEDQAMPPLESGS